ncbi:O-glycoside alpha-1,2-mannosyltransferase omh1 [Smittium mucronatum]|uniref:O-glycoside alpha-1,2-mannosyltransferase omh1 n=1 Tax=Smittium mucronatum TaxID=133383 RepID=A0A1R0GZ00_9FUNG|nr:O-glycoside alpha-1,2-mannosyltransferase omh1 [Smittium mucronatum]
MASSNYFSTLMLGIAVLVCIIIMKLDYVYTVDDEGLPKGKSMQDQVSKIPNIQKKPDFNYQGNLDFPYAYVDLFRERNENNYDELSSIKEWKPKDPPKDNSSFRDFFSNPIYRELSENEMLISKDSSGTPIVNIEEYRNVIYNKSYSNESHRWEEEIAPFVWRFKGQKPTNDTITILPRKESAVILILVRNSELKEMIYTMERFERSFNSRYNYPYVFLNDVPFNFKFISNILKYTSSNVSFGLVPKAHWSIPPNINDSILKQSLQQLKMNGVAYGDSQSYRHMCRFYSGFFYKHPLLQQFEYYWRIEPDVDYFCEINYDPFSFMKKNNKLYSFVISIKELPTTIYSLWKNTLLYGTTHNVTSYMLDFFASKNGNYNLCHFWSNFEIASFGFYRTKEYQSYFDFLDKTGNFFYERWGDAPVHSLAAGLFLKPSQIHFFNDIGYRHDDFYHCPNQKPFLSSQSDKLDSIPSEKLLVNESDEEIITESRDKSHSDSIRDEYNNISKEELECPSNVCKCPLNAFVIDDVSFSCLPKYKKYKSTIWTPDVFRKKLDDHIKNNHFKYPDMLHVFVDQRKWRDYTIY